MEDKAQVISKQLEKNNPKSIDDERQLLQIQRSLETVIKELPNIVAKVSANEKQNAEQVKDKLIQQLQKAAVYVNVRTQNIGLLTYFLETAVRWQKQANTCHETLDRFKTAYNPITKQLNFESLTSDDQAHHYYAQLKNYIQEFNDLKSKEFTDNKELKDARTREEELRKQIARLDDLLIVESNPLMCHFKNKEEEAKLQEIVNKNIDGLLKLKEEKINKNEKAKILKELIENFDQIQAILKSSSDRRKKIDDDINSGKINQETKIALKKLQEEHANSKKLILNTLDTLEKNKTDSNRIFRILLGTDPTSQFEDNLDKLSKLVDYTTLVSKNAYILMQQLFDNVVQVEKMLYRVEDYNDLLAFLNKLSKRIESISKFKYQDDILRILDGMTTRLRRSKSLQKKFLNTSRKIVYVNDEGLLSKQLQILVDLSTKLKNSNTLIDDSHNIIAYMLNTTRTNAEILAKMLLEIGNKNNELMQESMDGPFNLSTLFKSSSSSESSIISQEDGDSLIEDLKQAKLQTFKSNDYSAIEDNIDVPEQNNGFPPLLQPTDDTTIDKSEKNESIAFNTPEESLSTNANANSINNTEQENIVIINVDETIDDNPERVNDSPESQSNNSLIVANYEPISVEDDTSQKSSRTGKFTKLLQNLFRSNKTNETIDDGSKKDNDTSKIQPNAPIATGSRQCKLSPNTLSTKKPRKSPYTRTNINKRAQSNTSSTLNIKPTADEIDFASYADDECASDRFPEPDQTQSDLKLIASGSKLPLELNQISPSSKSKATDSLSPAVKRTSDSQLTPKSAKKSTIGKTPTPSDSQSISKQKLTPGMKRKSETKIALSLSECPAGKFVKPDDATTNNDQASEFINNTVTVATRKRLQFESDTIQSSDSSSVMSMDDVNKVIELPTASENSNSLFSTSNLQGMEVGAEVEVDDANIETVNAKNVTLDYNEHPLPTSDNDTGDESMEEDTDKKK